MNSRMMLSIRHRCLSSMILLIGLVGMPAIAQDDSVDSLFSEDFETETESATEDATAPTATSEEEMTLEQVLDIANQLYSEGRYLEAISNYSRILITPGAQGNITALMGRGKAFFELQSYDLALKSINEVLRRTPNNHIALFERGKIFMEIENYREAADDFERAVEINPANSEYLRRYGTASIKFGEKESRLGNLEAGENIGKGVRTLGTVVTILDGLLADAEFSEQKDEIVAELAEAHYERGLGNFNLGESDAALDDMSRAHDLDPDNLDYAERLALSYMDKGAREAVKLKPDPEKIITNLTTAITIFQETIEKAEAKEAEDEAAFDAGSDADLGIEDAAAAADDVPYDTNKIQYLYAQMSRARIELAKQVSEDERNEHYENVIAYCDAALDRDPEFGEAHLVRGVALRMLNEYEKAIDAFTEARLSPLVRGEALFRRGIAWYYLGESELALRDFDSVRSSTTGLEDPRAQFWSGVIHLKNGDHLEAIDLLSDSLNNNPNYILSYSNRGIAYLHVGDYERALRDFDQIIRREPRSPKGYYLRGVALEMMDSSDRAAKSFQRAVELDPDHEPSLQRMSR